jgi:hypothetical protein
MKSCIPYILFRFSLLVTASLSTEMLNDALQPQPPYSPPLSGRFMS